jgi:hypothetical protein
MMTRLLSRWPRMPDVHLFLRSATVSRGLRRVRPCLVVLEDRVAPAAFRVLSDHPVDEGAAAVMSIKSVVAQSSAAQGDSTDSIVIQVPAAIGDGGDANAATSKSMRVKDNPDVGPPALIDNADDIPLMDKKGRLIGGPKSGGEQRLLVASARSFLVAIRIDVEPASVVPDVARSTPATPSTAVPTTTTLPSGTAAPTTVSATPAVSGTQAVLLGPDVIASSLSTATAVPGQPRAFSPTATGLVLANFPPAPLDLPRSGGDTASMSDVGPRFGVPATGIPVNDSTMPGRAVPLPSAGTGAGVVTEDLPDPTMPAIELVPPVSDKASALVAPVETGIDGTAVFVATVAAVGLMAGAYYSQARRSGRGPRLKVRT